MGRESGLWRQLSGWLNRRRRPSGTGRLFQIELGSRHRWYLEPARLCLMVLCGLFGTATLWSVTQTVLAVRDRQELQTRVDQIREQDRQLIAEAQQEGIDLTGPSVQQLPAEVSLANQLLVKRHFSWTQFLSGLESAIPPRVSIKSVRLDSGSAVIHVTGFAVTVEDVTAFTVTLQDHPTFRDPVLDQHRMGPDGLVEFDLTVRYRPQKASSAT